ncbi:MAG: helix-turn-helix transcriptional regulator [Anaerolineae bacterium]|nr:MAG: helix-turn-helix transcriptional regulator [Anaerolineae bacterium]
MSAACPHRVVAQRPWASLTERERAILLAVGRGESNRDIARRLHITERAAARISRPCRLRLAQRCGRSNVPAGWPVSSSSCKPARRSGPGLRAAGLGRRAGVGLPHLARRGYDRTGAWQDGAPGPAMAYDLVTGASRPWDGALDGLYRAPCPNGACVRPLLTKTYQPADRLYFAGHYAEVLPSPDGRWYAFVAQHVYGPEDLVLAGRQE